MSDTDFSAQAAQQAVDTVLSGTGGPFGAVIVKDGKVIGRGANSVLATGDPTCHAEIMAIRDAARNLGREFMLEVIPTPEGMDDCLPARAKMLYGCEIYINGAPCPMCLSAIYWARISKVTFGCGFPDTSAIGFDDAFQYEDFAKPFSERRIPFVQAGREEGLKAYEAWTNKEDRIPY